MKRMNFLIGMLTLASAIALTGCDDVLDEFQKGLNGSETPAYSIVLSEDEAYVFKSAETELALLVVNTGDEATGALTAELTGDGREAFTLSKTKLPSIAAGGKNSTLVIAPVAGLAAGTYEATVVLSGEAGIAATLDVSFAVGEAGVLTVKGLEDGSHYEAEVYDYPNDDIADSADLRNIMSVFKFGGTGVGTAGNGTLEIGLQTPDGADFTADGDFLVVLKVAKNDSAPLMYKGVVPFTGGSATVEYDDMETATVEPSDPNNPNGPDEPEFYIVTFDGYEQAGEQRRWRGFVGDIIERPIDPTRDGFIFDDWYADASFTTLYKFDSPVTKDTTLYAKWIAVTEEMEETEAAKTYTVTFDTNGGDTAPESQTVVHGGTVTHHALNPTRVGYAFDGWYTSTALTTRWDFNTPVTDNITLYAKWIDYANTVSDRVWVIFVADGSNEVIPLQYIVPGSIVEEPAAPTRTGYDFAGWYTDYTNFIAGGSRYDFKTPVNENIMLYAKWVPVYYIVSFDTLGGSAVAPLAVQRGYNIPVPVTPSKEGYVFKEWYRDAECTDTWHFYNHRVIADTTLYAGWIPAR